MHCPSPETSTLTLVRKAEELPLPEQAKLGLRFLCEAPIARFKAHL